MKKILLAALVTVLPLLSVAADINVNLGGMRIQAPGVSVTFGSQDNRGYYWDGQAYRDPGYWREHDGHRGERYYTGRGRGHDEGRHGDREHCPPGQAKKGNC